MHVRILGALLLLSVLLVGSAWLVRAPTAQAVESVADDGSYRIVVQPATRATVKVLQVSGVAVGGSYRLYSETSVEDASIALPASSEAGCCCVYMPDVIR